jgi:hypothetical protein
MRLQTPLLILRSVGLFGHFCLSFNVCTVALRVADNVLALGAVADFGAQNCQYTTKVDARKNVQLTTSPAIEPNAC